MSLILTSNNADATFYLKDRTFAKYNTFNLCSITIKHVEVRQKIDFICYIHCTLVAKDDNFFNTRRSDIIGVVPLFFNNAKRYFHHKFPNIKRNMRTKDFNSIRISLRDGHGQLLDNIIEHVVYELEFF